MRNIAIILLSLIVLAAPALAETVTFRANGTVEWNMVNSGPLADVSYGDGIALTFTVDSDDFLDSATYNTRGYVINQDSFVMTLGEVEMHLQNPFPEGQTPYFVLRNGDPVADGFLISNNTDWPASLPSDIPAGIDPYFGVAFEVGYEGDTLNSLNILDAIGAYAYDGLTNFYFNVVDGPIEVIGVDFWGFSLETEGVAVESHSLTDVKSLFQ